MCEVGKGWRRGQVVLMPGPVGRWCWWGGKMVVAMVVTVVTVVVESVSERRFGPLSSGGAARAPPTVLAARAGVGVGDEADLLGGHGQLVL